MKRLRRMCLYCGRKPARRLGLLKNDPRMYCTQRCAAIHGMLNATDSCTALVYQWCNGCGWVAAESANVFEDYHEEGCPVIAEEERADIERYGSLHLAQQVKELDPYSEEDADEIARQCREHHAETYGEAQ